MEDLVNHPAHYKTKSGLETIDVIEAFTDGLNGLEATHTGNVLKYMCRWKKKNGLVDLFKAQWYLNRLIEQVENNEGSAESAKTYADACSTHSNVSFPSDTIGVKGYNAYKNVAKYGHVHIKKEQENEN